MCVVGKQASIRSRLAVQFAAEIGRILLVSVLNKQSKLDGSWKDGKQESGSMSGNSTERIPKKSKKFKSSSCCFFQVLPRCAYWVYVVSTGFYPVVVLIRPVPDIGLNGGLVIKSDIPSAIVLARFTVFLVRPRHVWQGIFTHSLPQALPQLSTHGVPSMVPARPLPRALSTTTTCWLFGGAIESFDSSGRSDPETAQSLSQCNQVQRMMLSYRFPSLSTGQWACCGAPCRSGPLCQVFWDSCQLRTSLAHFHHLCSWMHPRQPPTLSTIFPPSVPEWLWRESWSL